MKPGDIVQYIPTFAEGDEKYAEQGIVSSLNSNGEPFVKFFAQLERFGWEGTTSQCCYPSDLTIIKEF